MREILFRGKRCDNGEWVEGYYVYDESGQTTENPTAYICHLNAHPCGYSLIPYEVDPETVGQFTGLTDKNGEKIFEGDVFAWNDNEINEKTGRPYPDEISVVCFDDKKAAFVSKTLNGACEDLCVTISDNNSRYVGNIHDNPELLEEKENDK